MSGLPPRQAALMQTLSAADHRGSLPLFGLATGLLATFRSSVARVAADRQPASRQRAAQQRGRCGHRVCTSLID
jgi:hypothetical protein